MALNTLEDMFVFQLEEMYYIENQLVDALDEMASDATNDKLEKGFEEHREETREHVRRVEEAFDALGRQPNRRESMVLDALIQERQQFHQEARDEHLRDLFDTVAGIKTERMEITGYQGLLVLANKLDLDDDVTDPLQDNLSSEKSALRELEALSKGSKLKAMIGQLTP